MRNINYLTAVCLCLCPVGIEDMVLSALVQEQMEGITPEAIVLMTPKKMAVSFANDFRAMFTPRINLYVAPMANLVQLFNFEKI